MNKQLTVFEASCIITGYGIGSGVLAMPYISAKCGFPMTILIIALAFIFSFILHMMIADLSIKNGCKGQIIEIFMHYLDKDKRNKTLKLILFVFLAIVLYTNLAVYISGAAEILSGAFNLPLWLGKLLFYVFAAFVAMFGLKFLGICEKYAMLAIFAVVSVLFIGSVFNIKSSIPMVISSYSYIISFFGIAMFAFVAFFSVPQVVEGLGGDIKKVRKSILIGMLLNTTIMLVVIIGAQISSAELTKVAMTGWSAGIGLWAQILGSAFTILAMLTTYWSISLALRDIVSQSLNTSPKLSFFIASIPSLLITFIPSVGFLDFLELAAGAIAIIIALFVVPIFHISKKEGPSILGKFSSVIIEVIVFIAYIAMAVGNLV